MRCPRWLAPGLLSSREPPRTFGAKLLYGPRLVLGHILRGKGLSPPAVHPSIDEHLGAGVPEGASERNALGGVLLHPLKGAVLNNRLPLRFVDGNVEELSDATHLSRHILFEVSEVHEQDVRKVANLPPAANVLPERPEGMAVALQPLVEVLPDVCGRRLDGWPDAPRRVVERLVP